MKTNRFLYLLVVLFCTNPCVLLYAQGVCSGTALAPVYSQTFGSSPSSTTKTTVPVGFNTNYGFNNVGTDGHYIVTPLVQNSAKNDWTSGGDHTGNTNGNMFLVNAGTGASLFFSQQVDNLCPGSVFSFSAWLANVNTPNTLTICGSSYVYPKVIFNIKNTAGVKLASDTTVNLPLSPNAGPVNWKQYSFQFALPSGTTSLVLEMVDFYGGKPQCGNDLAVDDILFSACTPLVTATLSTAPFICYGTATSITSSLVNSPFSHPAYQWQKSLDGGVTWINVGIAGTGSSVYSIAGAVLSDSGSYRVLVGPDVSSLTSSTCVAASNTVSLMVNPPLSLAVSSNSPVCSGNILNLMSAVSGGTGPYVYNWTGPNGFSSGAANPFLANISSAAGGNYSLTVTDSKNCSAAGTTSIAVGTSPPSVAAINGNNGGCAGSSLTLTDVTPGGVWSSSNSAVATINQDGTVTLLSGGNALISYTVSNGSCAVTVTKLITVASVALHKDIIECGNSMTSFNAIDPYYGVSYGNSNAGSSYAWSISGGTFSFQSPSSPSSQYPDVQFGNGSAFQVIIQFTTNGITCSDTQMIYKNIPVADTILGSRDTTVCFNTASIPLSGKSSSVSNTFQWTSSGTGSFSNPNSLNTNYIPGAADKNGNPVILYLKSSSTIQSTASCGTGDGMDSMILRILPDNKGVNTSQVFCSNKVLNFTPVSTIPGSSYSWVSAVSSGSVTGNTANGTGNIIDSLVNLSTNTNAVIVYTLTPFAITASNKTCPGTPFTYTVTVLPDPALIINNSSSSVCSGSNSNIQFSGSVSGTGYTWTSLVITGSAAGNSSNNIASSSNKITDHLLILSGSKALIRYYITAVSPSGCSKTDSTDIVVFAMPTIANAGPDQLLCNVPIALLSGNSPLMGTGNWVQLSGPSPVIFGAPNAASGTVSGMVPGNYQLSWIISNGSCPASADTVIIINSPQTIGGSISGGATVCSGNNSGTVSLTGYTGNILRWEASTDNGNTWTAVSTDSSHLYSYVNLTVSTIFRAVVQSGNCSIVNSNPVAVIVNPLTNSGVLTADAMVCEASNSGTLLLSGYTGSILRWEYSVNNGLVWNTITDTTIAYDYTNLATTTLFRVVVQNGGCGPAVSNTVTIKVNQVTVPGVLAASTSVCAAINNGTILLSGYSGSILHWESSTDNGNTWNIIADTTNHFNYNNLTATTLFRVLLNNGACSSLYSNTVTITVLPAVTVANAGPDQQLCNTENATLNGNNPGSGTGKWTAVPGNPSSVHFNNPSSPVTSIDDLTTGVYKFVWTISNSQCADSRDTVTITVNQPTVPGTLSASATVCSNNNNGTLLLNGYGGTIIHWEYSSDNGNTWVIIADTTNSFIYNNLNITTMYRVLVQRSVCTPRYSNIVTITAVQAVSAANAGPDQQICNTGSATLAANNPVSGTGKWTAASGNPSAVTFTNPSSSTTTVRGLTAGSYQFIWTISNNICTDSRDTVTVTVASATVPGILSADAVVCSSLNNGTVSLNGYNGSIIRWESSVDSGNTWINVSDTTNTLSYTNLTATTQYRVLVQSGACGIRYSNTVTVTVLRPVTAANAGPDQQLCNTGTTSLTANIPLTGSGFWSAAAGNPSAAIFSNASLANTSVRGLMAGTYQFIWTITNGGCGISRDTVQVIVYSPADPGILAANATVCSVANNGTLILSGYKGNILNWESSVDNGNSWQKIYDTSNSFTYNNVTTTTQYRAYVKNAVCAAMYSNVVSITVLQKASIAIAGPDTTVINGITSYKLNGNTPSSGTGNWTVVPGGPSALGFVNASDPTTTVSGLTFNAGTPPADGIYKLVWTISNGYCPSSSDTMQIRVQPPTDPGAVAYDTVVCYNNNQGIVTLTDYLGTILQWEYSTDYGSNWTILSRTVGTNQDTLHFENLATTTLYRALVRYGIGLSLYSGIAATITVLQPVSVANAGIDQVLCNTGTAMLSANTPITGTGFWTSVTGNPSNVNFSDPKNPGSLVNGLTSGNYLFVWTISDQHCFTSSDTVSITVVPPAIAGYLAADTSVCITAGNGILNLTGFRGFVAEEEISTDGGNTWSVVANTSHITSFPYTNLTATSQFRVLVKNAICPALYSNTVTVTVLQEATIANAGTDQHICNAGSAVLSGNQPVWGNGTWNALPGNPSAVNFTDPASPNTTVYGLTTGTYYFSWTINNTSCANSTDTVAITVDPATIPGTLTGSTAVCATNNSGVITLTGYRGKILYWEFSIDNGNTWTKIADTTSSYSYNNLTATTLFRTAIQNGGCDILYSTIETITVLQPVTQASAGPDQQLCDVHTATLAANIPASGNGVWTAVTGNPSNIHFTDPASPNTTVDGLSAGTYQLIWTISNLLCTSSSDTLSITVYPATVPGVLSGGNTVCGSSNTGTLSLTGYEGNIIRWEYSVDNGSSWTILANNTTSYTYTNLNVTTQFRAAVQSGGCVLLYSNIVTITVLQPVSQANAGADQQLCDVASITLAATAPGSGTGLWSAPAGNPSAVSFTDPYYQSTTVNGLIPGNYRFVWNVSNGVCNNSADTVLFTIFPPTLPGVLTADRFVCASGNNGTLFLKNYSGTIIHWESSTDNGISWTAIDQITDTLSYSNLQTTTQYRVLVQNNICNILYSNTVTIHVYQLTAGGHLSPQEDTVCSTVNSGTLQLKGFTGIIIHWETSTDKGNTWKIINYTDSAYLFTALTTTTWFRVFVENGNCTAAYSDTAVIIVDALTTAGTLNGTAILCKENNTGLLYLTGRTGDILKWEASTDNGTSWNSIAHYTDTLVYTNLTVSTMYRVLVKNGACATDYTNSIPVTVVEPVTKANAGADQVLCNAKSFTALEANTPTEGAGLWKMVSGPSTAILSDPLSPACNVSSLEPGTYQFVWTISNGICSSSSDTVEVKVDNVISEFSLMSITDCGKTSFEFTNNSSAEFGVQNYYWLTGAGDTITTKDPTLVFTNEGLQSMGLFVKSNTGCTSTTQAIYKVTIFQYPKANINAIADICKSQLIKVSSSVSSKDSIIYILWNLGNTTKLKDSVVTVQYTTDGKYTVQLTVATINHCFDSAYKQINVHPLPTVTVSNLPLICRGDTALLTANGASNYIWTDQNNNIICNGCTSTTVKPTANSQYNIIGYSQYGCSQTQTTSVRVIQPFKLSASMSDSICAGQSIRLFASGAATYNWYPATGLNNSGSSSPIAKPQITTSYQVIGKDDYNCFTDTATIRITVGSPTPIHIGNDTTVTAGSTYQLTANPDIQNIRKWNWSGAVDFSCRNCSSPQIKINNDAVITCYALNAFGCPSTDTIQVKTFCPDTDVFIPNAFTPDGDGINDLLMVQGKAIQIVKSFRIFNRWGEMVFEKTNFLPGDPAYAWDGKVRGKPASPDIYVYMCEVICAKGTAFLFKGNVGILK